MTDIYIVGEDSVTRAIIRRLIKDYAPNLSVLREEPVRGSQMKGLVSSFNKLAQFNPVVLLGDLDTDDCAPAAKQKLLNGEKQSEDFLVNIAVDEAEAWLYADKEGLSSYLGVPSASIPDSSLQRMGGPRERLEVEVNLKTSMHLTKTLVLESSKEELKNQILSPDGRCKGKEYNSAMVPFIEEYWSPERARLGSYSLDGTIRRIILLNNRRG